MKDQTSHSNAKTVLSADQDEYLRPSKKFRRKGQRLRGFSLVETALALGIAGFALVPILGMLPVALNASRTSSDLTITTQIGQRMLSLAQQTATKNYGTLIGSYYYFDDQGQPLALTNGTTPPNGSIYSAYIYPAQAGTTASLVDAANVASLQIYIANDPAHVLQGTPAATVPARLQSRTIVIPVFLANNGS